MDGKMSTHRIICGHVLDVLRDVPNGYVDMLMTSVPYWGLRDYGKDTATDWGDWHGQLGLEPTPELYIEHLRMVFAEVMRVLKKTGTCWVNIGDTYAGSGCGKNDYRNNNKRSASNPMLYCDKPSPQLNSNLPAKSMMMIPERFAFMMIDLGYILRNKIIWHKPNPMPSSVKDRFNTTYEMLYFFSKSKKYWFDLDAVREEPTGRKDPIVSFGKYNEQGAGYKLDAIKGKNPGDVIVINTQPFAQCHFAVFPEKLCEKPILAGCPAEICKYCGIARVRITKSLGYSKEGQVTIRKGEQQRQGKDLDCVGGGNWQYQIIGWTDCLCSEKDKYEPGIIIDPFAGSGTVGVVAEKLRRNSVLIDIKRDYCEMAYKRMESIAAQITLSGKRSTITKEGF